MVASKEVVASTVAVSAALAFFVRLITQTSPYFNALFAACPAKSSALNFPYEWADEHGLGWACVPMVFLEDAAINSGARLATAVLFNGLVGINTLWALESCKTGAKWCVRWLGVTMVLCLTLAVSVALPLAWLPSYWLGMGSSARAAGAPKRAQLEGAAAAALVCALPGVLLHNVPLPEEWKVVLYAAWVPLMLVGLPAAGWLAGRGAWLAGGATRALAAPPATPAAARDAHAAAARTYHLVAGLLLLHHASVGVAFAAAGAPWGEIGEVLLRRDELSWQAAYFLLLDAVALILGLGAFAGMERGFGAFLAYLVGSLALGPGTALALLAGAREEQAAAAQLLPGGDDGAAGGEKKKDR